MTNTDKRLCRKPLTIAQALRIRKWAASGFACKLARHPELKELVR